MILQDFSKNIFEITTDFINKIPSQRMKRYLWEASSFVQPLWISSQIRLIQLDKGQIELKIPSTLHNCKPNSKQIEEAILVLAATRAGQIFFEYQKIYQKIELKSFEVERLVYSEGPVFVRLGVSDVELLSFKLKALENKNIEVELPFLFIDADKKRVIQMNSYWKLQVQNTIDE